MVLLQRETETVQGLVREFVNKNKGSELALEIVWIKKKAILEAQVSPL